MATERDLPGSDWRLDMTSRELLRDGQPVRLPEKPFLVLAALLEADGGVVTRESLRKRLWPDDTFVDFDNNLNSAVATVRQILGDSAKAPTYVETIPKIGYRWIGAGSAGVGAGRTWTRPVAAAIVLVAVAVAITTAALLRGRADRGVADANRHARAHFDRGVYLRGQFVADHTRATSLDAALEAFDAAVAADPSFADAAAEQADTLIEMSFAGRTGFRDGLARARDAAGRALALVPDQRTAARVTGLAALFLDWDFDAARTWLDRAASGSADAKTSLARAMWFAAAGQPDAAIDEAERAAALDPAAYYVRADLAMFYLTANRNVQAAESSRLVLDVAPDFVPAMAYALLAHERLEQWSDAARQARRLMRASGATGPELAPLDHVDGRTAVDLWRRWDLARLERYPADRRADLALPLALRHAMVGDRAAALDGLAEALSRRTPLLVFLRAYPELANLRGDPRFEAIAHAINPAIG